MHVYRHFEVKHWHTKYTQVGSHYYNPHTDLTQPIQIIQQSK